MMDWATNYARAYFSGITFPDLCSILEPPVATEADKGQEPDADFPDDWTVILSNEPCLFYPSQAMAREGATASQIQEEGAYRIEVRYNAPRPSARAIVRVEVSSNPLAITGATNATPIVITSAAHKLMAGSTVSIKSVLGNTAANGHWVIEQVLSANTFSLKGSVGNGGYTSGGFVRVLLDFEIAGIRDGSYPSEKIFDLKRAR